MIRKQFNNKELMEMIGNDFLRKIFFSSKDPEDNAL
jgi:hypothetical protein